MTLQILENRYSFLRELGSGGFGDTFLAEDTHMPSGRRCVVKRLKPMTDDPQVYELVKERFQREAAILEDLGNGHPQIPSLYAYFESDEQFYLIQEWVEGTTLSQQVQQQGTLSESSVKEILVGILPVLEFVHSQRIVHRDIKPDNIIWRTSDSKPVLIDFGAVKETMGTVMTTSGNNTRSIVIGTPGFMPSEQTAGRPVFSSDLYSLGLTAIYLLTGKTPQELETNPETGEIVWRKYALSISPSFAGILDKAIQSHWRDRYSSATEMLKELQTGANSVFPPTVPSVGTEVSTAPVGAATVTSQPPIEHSLPTEIKTQIASAFVEKSESASVSSSNSGLGDLQKTLIIGGIIAVAILGGFALTNNSQPVIVSESNSNNEQQSSQETTVTNSEVAVTTPPTTNSSAPVTSPQVPIRQQSDSVSSGSSLPRSIGWMRIGAVGNTSGVASVGDFLIETTQPVTISPSAVPSIGDRVTIVNGVHIRDNYPLPPRYKLASKKATFLRGQEIVILNLHTFTDPTMPSPYTVVWAEVGLP